MAHLGAFGTQGGYSQCLPPGASQKALVKHSSPRFTSGAGLDHVWLSSSVEIERSPAAAKREFALARKALANPRVVGCIERRFGALGGQPGSVSVKGHHIAITVRDLRMVPIELAPPAGTDATAGFTMQFVADYRFTARGRRVDFPAPFLVEVSAFAIGRAEVNFASMSMGQPMSVRLEDRLYSTLVSRALAASHLAPAAVQG